MHRQQIRTYQRWLGTRRAFQTVKWHTPHTHLYYGEGGKTYAFLGKKKGYDEFAYDALIGILGGIASWKYGAERLDEKYLQTLIDRGERVGEVYKRLTPVKEIKKTDLTIADGEKKAIAVQLPSFDEFIEKHGDYLKLMLLEEILSKSPKRISEEEEKKIEKTIEIAIDAAKKLAETYGDPEKLVHAGLMEIRHAKDALAVLEFLNPEKHPLDVIGDHIIELKKMHPEVVKPEKVYGKEWYEFLKKKGIDPKTLEPIGSKKPAAPKFRQVPKEVEKEPKERVNLEAQKLLGILSGLKYAGYPTEAVRNAVDDIIGYAGELAERSELEALGLYLWTAHLLREGRFEEAEKFLKRNT